VLISPYGLVVAFESSQRRVFVAMVL